MREHAACADQRQLERLQGVDAMSCCINRLGEAGDSERAGPFAVAYTNRRTDLQIDPPTSAYGWRPDVVAARDALPERHHYGWSRARRPGHGWVPSHGSNVYAVLRSDVCPFLGSTG